MGSVAIVLLRALAFAGVGAIAGYLLAMPVILGALVWPSLWPMTWVPGLVGLVAGLCFARVD